MKFHREGRTIIRNTVALLAICIAGATLAGGQIGFYISTAIALVPLVLVLQFFRVPLRTPVTGEDLVICPADGKVVVIEETDETEYFRDRRLQVSIFMSPVNVHINWHPIAGKVACSKYHPGKYLVAWHPKSSTENERTTVVVQRQDGVQVLFRQIAGALARRIICYAGEGQHVAQCSEFGFIKFGSRVDVFLPLGTEVQVQLGQVVKGSQTVLARIPIASS
jgi:phosphatidylserine decarboxylase